MRASTGYSVPGLNRYPCRRNSSSIQSPYTPCAAAWCRMWTFQNVRRNSRSIGSRMVQCILRHASRCERAFVALGAPRGSQCSRPGRPKRWTLSNRDRSRRLREAAHPSPKRSHGRALSGELRHCSISRMTRPSWCRWISRSSGDRVCLVTGPRSGTRGQSHRWSSRAVGQGDEEFAGDPRRPSPASRFGADVRTGLSVALQEFPQPGEILLVRSAHDRRHDWRHDLGES